MSISIETYKEISSNAELATKLEALWKENASSAQFLEMLEAEGIHIEASQVEEILANMQSKRAADIALEDVDDEQLRKVAGGSNDDGYDFSCVGDFLCYSNLYEQCTENFYVPCTAFSILGLY